MFIIDFVRTQKDGESIYGLFYKPDKGDAVKLNYAESNHSTEQYEEPDFSDDNIYKITESTSPVTLSMMIKSLTKYDPAKLMSNTITEGAVAAYEAEQEEIIRRDSEYLLSSMKVNLDILVFPVYSKFGFNIYCISHNVKQSNGNSSYTFIKVLSPFVSKEGAMKEAIAQKEMYDKLRSIKYNEINVIYKDLYPKKPNKIIQKIKNIFNVYFLRRR